MHGAKRGAHLPGQNRGCTVPETFARQYQDHVHIRVQCIYSSGLEPEFSSITNFSAENKGHRQSISWGGSGDGLAGGIRSGVVLL